MSDGADIEVPAWLDGLKDRLVEAVQSAAASAPAEPPLPPARPLTFAERAEMIARTGWRPASGWICVAILAVNGAVLPLARLRGVALEPLDWHELTPFAALLVAHAGMRTAEKIMGASA